MRPLSLDEALRRALHYGQQAAANLGDEDARAQAGRGVPVGCRSAASEGHLAPIAGLA